MGKERNKSLKPDTARDGCLLLSRKSFTEPFSSYSWGCRSCPLDRAVLAENSCNRSLPHLVSVYFLRIKKDGGIFHFLRETESPVKFLRSVYCVVQ